MYHILNSLKLRIATPLTINRSKDEIAAKRQATNQDGKGAAISSLLDEAGSKQVDGLWNLSDQD